MSSRFVAELSDGERQRAMITRVLAQDASLMIMDEPTAFLDIAGKYEIFSLLHKIAQENGKTIIFSTHDLQMALSCADKIWALNNSALFESSPEDFFRNGIFDKIFDTKQINTRRFIPFEGAGEEKIKRINNSKCPTYPLSA